MKTTKKEFMEKVQKTILQHFDNVESLKNEINHYFKIFGYGYGVTMIEYGCFDCYYNDCADSMAGWFDCSVDDIWAYYKEDSQKLWQWYIHFIVRELEHIRTNKKCYI